MEPLRQGGLHRPDDRRRVIRDFVVPLPLGNRLLGDGDKGIWQGRLSSPLVGAAFHLRIASSHLEFHHTTL